MFSPYPGCHEVRSTLSEFFQSLSKSRMWWYNILGDNEGSMPHILQLDPITGGSILLTVKLVVPKKENYDTILTVKITEWRKFIDYFGQNIESNPSKVGQKNPHSVRIGYIPRPSSVNIHISRHHLDFF